MEIRKMISKIKRTEFKINYIMKASKNEETLLGLKVMVCGKSENAVVNAVIKAIEDMGASVILANNEIGLSKESGLFSGMNILVNCVECNIQGERRKKEWELANSTIKNHYFLCQKFSKDLKKRRQAGRIINIILKNDDSNGIYSHIINYAVQDYTKGIAAVIAPYKIIMNGIVMELELKDDIEDTYASLRNAIRYLLGDYSGHMVGMILDIESK